MGPGGLGSLGLLLLWAATHTWYLSPPCVRVADAKCTGPDPGPLSLLCSPLSVRVGHASPSHNFPFPLHLDPWSRPHNLTPGRTPVLFGGPRRFFSDPSRVCLVLRRVRASGLIAEPEPRRGGAPRRAGL